MRRPFLYRRLQRHYQPDLGGRRTLMSGAQRVRRLGRALNPVDGIPHPFPSLSAPPAAPSGETIASPARERAMRNLWWDGFFAECADVIWLQYFPRPLSPPPQASACPPGRGTPRCAVAAAAR